MRIEVQNSIATRCILREQVAQQRRLAGSSGAQDKHMLTSLFRRQRNGIVNMTNGGVKFHMRLAPNPEDSARDMGYRNLKSVQGRGQNATRNFSSSCRKLKITRHHTPDCQRCGQMV